MSRSTKGDVPPSVGPTRKISRASLSGRARLSSFTTKGYPPFVKFPSHPSRATRSVSRSTQLTCCLPSGREKPSATKVLGSRSNSRMDTASLPPSERLIRQRGFSGGRRLVPLKTKFLFLATAKASTSGMVSHFGFLAYDRSQAWCAASRRAPGSRLARNSPNRALRMEYLRSDPSTAEWKAPVHTSADSEDPTGAPRASSRSRREPKPLRVALRSPRAKGRGHQSPPNPFACVKAPCAGNRKQRGA
ncbi:hypothetical protein FBZ94_1173 [Bradyrhizobium sacchari]|uniref:Uncharacterized protein n=1 Tax=Bradyrhizobium sacchari TaxID=1399419 RepID=A0A560J533_9BRAD|nr:hypothetical protein FBZ94_1173 [Bradyrhizobium sacchari]TWB66328.1 hypothetical protein FBZ95_11631 [Bradyrhizobium sacchari]